jgi:hypothetical protein
MNGVEVFSENAQVVTMNSGVVFPAGHVIQVVQFLDNATSASTTSTSLVDAVDGLSNPIMEKNITITSGNSVLIIANLTQQISGGGADKAGHVGLKRILDPSGAATTSTVYQQGSDAIYAESLATSANLTITMNNNICYLDSSTSSATNITYRLMHSAGIRGGSSLIRGNSYYTMTLFEIQA